MKRSLLFTISVFTALIFSEIGSFIAVRSLLKGNKTKIKRLKWIWILATVFLYLLVFTIRFFGSNFAINIVVNIYFGVFIVKFFVAITYFIVLISKWLKRVFSHEKTDSLGKIDRREFASKIALGVATIPFATLIYGIAKTAYDFKVHRKKLNFSNLPKPFNGLKIVQISDIHTGSLQGKYQLQKAIDIVKNENADLIVFTGDLVNNISSEAKPYLYILSQLTAPLGVFSTLGNHDYGDYYYWEDKKQKEKNFQEMLDIHKEIGWELLNNKSVNLEKEGEKIALIGVENWGANLRFKKYGDLKKAIKNTEQIPFKILLSHDPSHWRLEVLEHHRDIDLTLSGHTHGFQFGFEFSNFKWSPSQYLYPHWSGLYSKNNQFLYVNRGLGCIGYMGRVGIKPEITVLTLET
jgi:uncharacterized protein